jgi:3,4-dihydroxy-2-butanone 4-phosphate synthase
MKPIPLKPHPMNLNTIDELLADMRAGKMVVLMDDEDRENEGDLIIAAEHVRAEDINFMAHYGRGLICLTLTRERCRQLRLPLMVSDTNVDHRTNFTVSIEAAEGDSHRRATRGACRGSASARPHLSADGAARGRADASGAH